MNYKYLIYGLKVESEFEIEEAYRKEFDAEADVRVGIGDIPQEVLDLYEDSGNERSSVAVTKEAMIFRIDGEAYFWVTKDVITIAPFEGSNMAHIKSYLLGSSFGYCFFLRKQVLLHGGAVAKYGKGVIVTGESGAGKSTVSDALSDKEYLFVSDDVCAISFDGDKPHINMAFPQKKLCRDAALKRGYDLSELIYIDEDRDKFALRLKDGFLPEGIDFDYLFELVFTEEDTLSFKEVQGHEKLMLVLRNVFRGEDTFRIWGASPEYMQLCLNLASKVRIFQIARPKDKDTLKEIVDFIDSTVKG